MGHQMTTLNLRLLLLSDLSFALVLNWLNISERMEVLLIMLAKTLPSGCIIVVAIDLWLEIVLKSMNVFLWVRVIAATQVMIFSMAEVFLISGSNRIWIPHLWPSRLLSVFGRVLSRLCKLVLCFLSIAQVVSHFCRTWANDDLRNFRALRRRNLKVCKVVPALLHVYTHSTLNRVLAYKTAVILARAVGGGVVNADLVEVPVPDVVKQTPDYIAVALDHAALCPKVPWWKTRKLLKIGKHFLKVSRNSCHISRCPVHALNSFISTAYSIQQVTEKNPVAAVLWKIW